MIVTIVRIYVQREFVNEFIDATRENHHNTRKEPGNLRFDVLQAPGNPEEFILYEVFRDKESAIAHKNTLHYFKWKETVASWMQKPREGVEYSVIAPTEVTAW